MDLKQRIKNRLHVGCSSAFLECQDFDSLAVEEDRQLVSRQLDRQLVPAVVCQAHRDRHHSHCYRRAGFGGGHRIVQPEDVFPAGGGQLKNSAEGC